MCSLKFKKETKLIYFFIFLISPSLGSVVSVSQSRYKFPSSRACISSDEEFEKVYRYLNNTESARNSGIDKWNWRNTNIIKNCSSDKSLKFMRNFTKDGFLIAQDTFYSTEDYCDDTKDNTARICDLNKKKTMIKCCPEDEIWDYWDLNNGGGDGGCIKSPIPYRPKNNQFVINSTVSGGIFFPFKILQKSYDANTSLQVPREILKCDEGFELKIFTEESCANANMNSNPSNEGSLIDDEGVGKNSIDSTSSDCSDKHLYESTCRFQLTQFGVSYESSSGLFHRKPNWKQVDPHFYCVDGYFNNRLCHSVDPSTDNKNLQELCAESFRNILMFCEKKESSPTVDIYLASIWLSTCPLLVSAAVANLLIIQKNVHGWTLSCYLMSMFFVNINSAVLALEEKAPTCRVIDFTMKFLYLSTLCWMTSINFGLWRTFRANLPRPATEPYRFGLNLLFSAGIPVVVVTITYYAAKANTCGNQFCALYGHNTLPYYSGPVIFFIIVNLILFIRTSHIIAGQRNETSSVLQREPNAKGGGGHLESFRLFTKLFLMTGSIWILRVVLLFLQLKDMYNTWYGVTLEALFSIPEAAFSIMVLLHPEFKKWIWDKYPALSRKLSGVLCCFKYTPTISLELGTRSTQSTNNTTINRSPNGSNR